jgi:hypothetical protein
LNIDNDVLYYACYLADKIKEYSSLFCGAKYKLRDYMMNAGKKDNIAKFMQDNALCIDNYCCELAIMYGNATSKKYVEPYIGTINSIRLGIRTNNVSNSRAANSLCQVASQCQTKEFMEMISIERQD